MKWMPSATKEYMYLKGYADNEMQKLMIQITISTDFEKMLIKLLFDLIKSVVKRFGK